MKCSMDAASGVWASVEALNTTGVNQKRMGGVQGRFGGGEQEPAAPVVVVVVEEEAVR